MFPIRRAYLAWCIFFASCCLPFSGVQAADPLLQLLSAPWYGSYVCNQGLTRLQLTLQTQTGSNQVGAEFVFSSDPDNPSVPTGSFSLKGTLNRNDRTLVLKQDRWIMQPSDPSYRMVDLEGRIFVGDAQATIQGRITTYGCQDFMVWQFFADSATGP